MGILICAGFILFGLTNLAFGHGIMNTFFVFMLATIFTQVTQASLLPNPCGHMATSLVLAAARLRFPFP